MGESDKPISDDIEVVEIGEGDIAVLLAALKRLNNGVYALKVTLDFLTSRIATLPDRVKEMEEALKTHEEFFNQESKKVTESLQKHEENIKKENQELLSNLRLQLDLFVEKLSNQLQAMQDLITTVNQDVNMIVSKLTRLR